MAFVFITKKILIGYLFSECFMQIKLIAKYSTENELCFKQKKITEAFVFL